ncbi:MAG TPA: hypothetical protein P5137_07025 [Candidatus Brocadiia bacterium]|nr:hypothetical protein [Candidatus Brocadiia bacterium]
MDPVVLLLCRSPHESPGRRDAEDAFAGKATELGIPTVLAPHLYHLQPSHPALVKLRQSAGRVIVAGWMASKALLWTARFLLGQGVDVASAVSLDENALDQAQRILPAFAPALRGSPAPPQIFDKPVPPRWYPVIDHGTCRRCGQCADFCLFGVYTLGDDRSVRVDQPDNCKNGCPACARVCPAGAIMFPSHEADRRIAGWEQALAAPVEAKASPAESDVDDGLDALIDELDRLDR